MKTKRILFIIAGVFNSIIGGLSAFMGLMLLLLRNALEEMLEGSFEIVQNYITALAEEDASYEYLLDLSKGEAIDFMMRTVTIIALVFVLIGAIYITFGVLNLLLAKRDNTILKRKKYLGTILVVASWLIMLFNVFNVLTTIAVYLKPKEDKNMPNKLYSASDN